MSADEDKAGRRRLAYTPLERLSVPHPVDRIKYIAGVCAGRRVLDLGAMDETAWKCKRGRGTWLHEEIARVARRVDGVDNSDTVPPSGLATAPNARIRHGEIMDLAALLAELEEMPEVVVAGELIEHLESPLKFLSQFRQARELAGSMLVISTPNATALHNVLIGAARRESTHQDHLCILSYKTLATLCRRAGFSNWSIVPYYCRFTEMQDRHSGIARAGIRATERIVNGLEWLFPLLSFGYIVQVGL